jgi:hypothetical protein
VLCAWELCVVACVAPFYAVRFFFQVCLFLVGVAIVRLPASTAPALGVGLKVLPPQLGDSVRCYAYLHRVPVLPPIAGRHVSPTDGRTLSFQFLSVQKSRHSLHSLGPGNLVEAEQEQRCFWEIPFHGHISAKAWRGRQGLFHGV